MKKHLKKLIIVVVIILILGLLTINSALFYQEGVLSTVKGAFAISILNYDYYKISENKYMLAETDEKIIKKIFSKYKDIKFVGREGGRFVGIDIKSNQELSVDVRSLTSNYVVLDFSEW